MPFFTEEKIMPYSAKQIFDLVMDIESYPKFLPWCKIAKITNRSDDNLTADLVINFKGLFEKYTSLVKYKIISDNELEITVSAIDGSFKYLINKWHLKNINAKSSQVSFFIDFSFRSMILEKIIGGVFQKATIKMMTAFEERAKILYK
jgi:coenzyme Q-binding protein COQ10